MTAPIYYCHASAAPLVSTCLPGAGWGRILSYAGLGTGVWAVGTERASFHMVSNPKRPVGHVPVVVRVFSQQEGKPQHTSPIAHGKSHGQGQIQEVEKQIPPLGGDAKAPTNREEFTTM